MTDPLAATVDLATALIRVPSSWWYDVNQTPVLAFTPPLSTAEQLLFADVVAMVALGMTDHVVYEQIAAYNSAVIAFLAVAVPTTAQTVQAMNATIRFLLWVAARTP